MTISNRDLKAYAQGDDPVMAALADEVLRHRRYLVTARRECAEVAGTVSKEAEAAIREHAQQRENENALGCRPTRERRAGH